MSFEVSASLIDAQVRIRRIQLAIDRFGQHRSHHVKQHLGNDWRWG
jgi:hypothetical protein